MFAFSYNWSEGLCTSCLTYLLLTQTDVNSTHPRVAWGNATVGTQLLNLVNQLLHTSAYYDPTTSVSHNVSKEFDKLVGTNKDIDFVS